MGEYNKVILIGFVSNFPKVMERVVKFTVATHHKSKGERITDWHAIAAFGNAMQFASQLQKGNQVVIEGQLRYSKYKEQMQTTIIADRITALLTDEELELRKNNPNNFRNNQNNPNPPNNQLPPKPVNPNNTANQIWGNKPAQNQFSNNDSNQTQNQFSNNKPVQNRAINNEEPDVDDFPF